MADRLGSGGIVQGEVGTQRTQRLPGDRQVLLCFRPTMLLADLTTGEQRLRMLEACSLTIRNGKAFVQVFASLTSLPMQRSDEATFPQRMRQVGLKLSGNGQGLSRSPTGAFKQLATLMWG